MNIKRNVIHTLHYVAGRITRLERILPSKYKLSTEFLIIFCTKFLFVCLCSIPGTPLFALPGPDQHSLTSLRASTRSARTALRAKRWRTGLVWAALGGAIGAIVRLISILFAAASALFLLG